MRSNYLVRITGLCAEMATKFTVDAHRTKKPRGQLQAVSSDDGNTQESRNNRASSWKPSTKRSNARPVWLGDEDAQKDSKEIAPDELLSGETTELFQFALFAKDLDSLRRRMLGASMCDRIWDMSREIADVVDGSGQNGPEQPSDGERSMKSVRDAITSAVLLLPYRGDARRAR